MAPVVLGKGAATVRRIALASFSTLVLWTVGAASVLAQEAPSTKLDLVLSPTAVRVQGVTPGGSVVLFGVDRVVGDDDYATILVIREIQEDGDRDGVIDRSLDHLLPARRVWVAVDLTSGAFDVSMPSGNGQRVEGWRGRGLLESGKPALEDLRGALEILLVRRGSGAWGQLVRDGAVGDDDGVANGRLVAAIGGLEPLGDSPPAPEAFQKDDLVFAVDSLAMSLIADRARGTR